MARENLAALNRGFGNCQVDWHGLASRLVA
jgi:hypothetical protein